MTRTSLTIVMGLAAATALLAQNPQPANPAQGPPVRDPLTTGYVQATELPDGAVPPVSANGNFIIGATHPPSPDTATKAGVPKGTVHTFTLNSTDSKLYPGIAREQGTAESRTRAIRPSWSSRPAIQRPTRASCRLRAEPVRARNDRAIHRRRRRSRSLLFTALDNLIAQKRVPVMIAVSIANGSGDAQGSQRGLEYDTMSGKYAEFVETEVCRSSKSSTA
jgi:hypothetical protein